MTHGKNSAWHLAHNRCSVSLSHCCYPGSYREARLRASSSAPQPCLHHYPLLSLLWIPSSAFFVPFVVASMQVFAGKAVCGNHGHKPEAEGGEKEPALLLALAPFQTPSLVTCNRQRAWPDLGATSLSVT